MIELDADVLASGPDKTLEIDPNMNGYVLKDGSTVIGELEIQGGEIRFKWASSGVAWPSSFTVEDPTGHTIPTIAVKDEYDHNTFPGSSASHDISACEYEILDGSTTVGWLKVNATETVWYGVPAYVSGGYLQYTSGSLTFSANGSSGSQTLLKVTDPEA